MMDRVPFVFLGAQCQERKIRHPEKIELRLDSSGELLHFGDAQTDPAQHFAGDLPFVRGEQDQIAFLDLQVSSAAPPSRLR